MKSAKRNPQLGKVSEGDREYFKRLGEVNAAVTRMDQLAGTLAEAIVRMGRIERSRGIDVVAIAHDRWPDYASHVNYIEAVRGMAAKERANRAEARTIYDVGTTGRLPA